MRASSTVRVVCGGLVLFACGGGGGAGGPSDSGAPEAPRHEAGAGSCSFSPSNLDLSKIDFSHVEDVVIGDDQTIETNDGGLLTGGSGHYTYQEIAQPGGPKLGVFAVKSLTIEAGAKAQVVGADALVIVALGDIRIAGKLYGNSQEQGGFIGPGVPDQPGGDDLPGLGLGGGMAGSAASAGSGAGYCGAGGDGASLGGAATTGGASWGSPTLVPLLPGANGGTGGVGAGGNGGGAIQLSACGSIHVSGTIHVGGKGGWSSGVYDSKGKLSQQASGGGSGGSLLLEAKTVDVTGKLAANGGGGGGDQLGGDAMPSDQPAKGGAGNGTHAAGGEGAAGSKVDGANGTSREKATSGGGGGAAGRIRINTEAGHATISGVVSPPVGECVTQGSF